jgi:valyl-tRNA synthetase
MGLEFAGDVPFREVYIHGLVRDAHGQKMSKSKGNVLDPIDLIDGIDLEALVAKRTTGLMQPEMAARIEKTTRKDYPDGIPAFGTDALRFTFGALATTGRDIKFDLGRIAGYRNFCNKLWNAARYVLMNTEGQDTGVAGGAVELSAPERWILSRLQETARQVNQSIAVYRFDLAAQAIYEFTWNEYCDWYLELSKPVLTAPDSTPEALRGTRRTLVQVLEALLRLAHPIMPFITEEIWQRAAPLAGRRGDTLMLQPFPQPDKALVDTEATAEMDWVMRIILAVRSLRGEFNLPPGGALRLLLQHGEQQDRGRAERYQSYLVRLARLSDIQWLAPDQPAPPAATALVGHLKLLVPLAGVIDLEAEITRLDREIARLGKDLERSGAKLSNPAYVERAPEEVVEKERDRVAGLEAARSKLQQQRERIRAL